MENNRGSFFIFLIIIAVLTLIIAALASFIVFVGITSPPAVAAGGGGAAAVAVAVEPPAEKDLATLVLIESGAPINLKSTDPATPHYALIETSIKYYIKVNGIKDVAAKITLETANLREIVTTYFMEMTVEEFSDYQTKGRVKQELKTELNNYLITTIPTATDRAKVGEVIYDVVFSAWNYS